MTCHRCSKEIDADSVFCRHCGAAVHETGRPRRLTRRPSEGKLGGVCAGIARYLDTDPTIVRLAWVILSVVPGFVIGGLIAYAAAWALLPGRRQRGADRHGSAAAAVHDGSEDCRGLRWARRVLRRRFNPLADCGRRSRDLSRSDHLRGAGVSDCLVCRAGGARRNAPAVTLDAVVAQHFCEPTA